jgi:phage major head subunit gpT-like protein
MEYYKDDASDLEDEDVSLDVPLRDEMGRLLAVAFDTLGM